MALRLAKPRGPVTVLVLFFTACFQLCVSTWRRAARKSLSISWDPLTSPCNHFSFLSVADGINRLWQLSVVPSKLHHDLYASFPEMDGNTLWEMRICNVWDFLMKSPSLFENHASLNFYVLLDNMIILILSCSDEIRFHSWLGVTTVSLSWLEEEWNKSFDECSSGLHTPML